MTGGGWACWRQPYFNWDEAQQSAHTWTTCGLFVRACRAAARILENKAWTTNLILRTGPIPALLDLQPCPQCNILAATDDPPATATFSMLVRLEGQMTMSGLSGKRLQIFPDKTRISVCKIG
jgi:hypothetical protein